MESDPNQINQDPSFSPPLSDASASVEPKEVPGEDPKEELKEVQPQPEWKKHPMFINHREDEIISFLIEMFETAEFPMKGFESVKYTQLQFRNHLFHHMFMKYGDTPESLHESKLLEKPRKSACEKKIVGQNVYFKCLDCELTSKVAFGLCADCYDKEKHRGHRVCHVSIPQGSSIVCGCGQDELLPAERFCNQHSVAAIGWEETLKTFPSEYQERYKTVVKKAFYGFMSLWEIFAKTSHEMTKIVLLKFADQIFSEIILFCEECHTTISQGFLSVFMDIMKDGFLESYDRFWRHCDAKSGPHDIEKSFACKCSILGRILQVVLYLRKDYQLRFGMIIFACVKNEQFREFFVLEYIKYFEYLYTHNYAQNTHPEAWDSHFVSTLANIEAHFFWNREDLLIKILKSGNFAKILLPLKRLVSEQRAITTSVDYTITRSMYSIGAFLSPKMKNAVNILITEHDIIGTFLNFVRACEINFGVQESLYILMLYEEVQFDAINKVMQCELQIRPSLDLLCFHLANSKVDKKEKSFFQNKLIKDWYELLIKTKADLVPPRIFAPGLERSLLSILWSHMQDEINLEKLEAIIREGLPEVKIEEVAENSIEAILKFFGMVRFITVQYNFDKGPIYFLYYNQMYNLFETDVMMIQLMTAWIQPEKLFSLLTKNFFYYCWSISDRFSSFSSEKYCGIRELPLMREFLEFLLFLMKDEVSYFNLRVLYDEMINEDRKFNPTARDLIMTQHIIQDTLVGAFSAPYFAIKSFLAQMFRKSPQLETVLRETTILDEVGQTLRLKPELQTEYDSSAFYKLPSINKLHDDAVEAKFSKKDKKFDIVSGRYDSAAPEYLKAIQRNMFQSDLVKFLGEFVLEFTDKFEMLLRSALRLILFGLNVLDEGIKTNWEGTEVLKSKAKENYLDREGFMENLNEISQNNKYEDCSICIDKIKNLLQKIFGVEDPQQVAKEKSDIIEEVDKKQLALNKMNKIKEEIAKKQALFAEKNLQGFQKSPEKIEKQQHVCQFCLEEVDNNDNEDFGFPIYISFTNNLYDVKNPLPNMKQDYSDLSKVSWWPVISSCNHHYHKRCFAKSNENMNLLSNRHFLSEVESTCLLCKSLCNSFLCLNDSKNSGLLGSLYHDMLLLLSEFKSRILNIANASVNEITERELLLRTYEYFTETFHVYEKPEALQGIFMLYTNVLRSLRVSLNDEEQKEEKITLFEEKIIESPECSFTKVFTNILLSAPEKQAQHQKLVLAQYLTFKVCQLILDEKSEEALNSLSDYITYFMTHKAFQSKVTNETNHFIQRIIFATVLNECTVINKQPDSKLFELLCSSKESLSELLSFIGIDFSFEEAVCRFASSQCEKEEVFIVATQRMKNVEDLQTAGKMAPKLVKLPQNYAEYVDKYIDVRCSLCQQMSPLLNGCLCLICGDLICGSTCDMVHRGNLNQHAKDYHMGVGYFIDRHALRKLLINTPVNCNLNGKGVYVDEFGQTIPSAMQSAEAYKVDFKKYFLNPASEQEDKEIINSYSLPRVCFREASASSNNNPAPTPGYF